jgi:hypothetical protein
MTSGATEQSEGAARPDARAMRAAFLAFAVLAAVMWIGIAIGANARTPGVVGLAATVFGGLFASVLTVAIGGAVALGLGSGAGAVPRPAVDAADAALAPALAELETGQAPVAVRLRERAAWRAPLGAAAGIALWCVFVTLGAPGGVLDFSAVILGGGLAGYGWALAQAARENRDIYLTRAANVLASGLGALTWRSGARVDAAELQALGLLPAPAASIKSQGEIAGAHAGLQLRITPFATVPPPGADKASAFKGLLVDIDTAQVAATTMEALLASRPALVALIEQLSTLPQLGAPRNAMASNRLMLMIPETGAPRVFDPPAQAGAQAAAPALARVRQVIGGVLHVVEALAAPTQA